MLYLRSMADLAVAVDSGALDAADGEYGVVLSVAASGFDRELELAGIWTDDILAVA